MMEGGSGGVPPGTRVPAHIMMPKHVAQVDRAIRVMPKQLALVITTHYLNGKKTSRRTLDDALLWLSGKLNNR